MTKKIVALAFGLFLAWPAFGQGTDKLALLIPRLFGPIGLVVDSQALLPDGSTHSAHFNSAFQAEFDQFNIALASQLATIPVPSPASGFTYTFDETLGVFQRSTDSFGPILAERAQTSGRRKLSFGFAYQSFAFDTLEGVELSAVPSVFTHDDFQLGGGRADVVTTLNSIEARVEQFSAYVSYGLSDRVDLALAVPFTRVDLAVSSSAQIQRIGTSGSPATHFFVDPSGGFGATRHFASSGSASGIGDVVARVKVKVASGRSFGLALGVDARLPTGDELDLLGLGAPGVRPFVALSLSSGRIAPHANLGYLWNGRSVLAGDPLEGTKGDMPDQLQYALGVDVGVTPRFTFFADLIGEWVVDSPRLERRTFSAADGRSFPQIGFRTASFNVANGSVGFKVNPLGKLLLDFNLLFSLNDAGLRDKLSPLVALEYTF